jgi:hypothetical protein
MSEEIKDTLWGAAAAAGVLVLLQIFGSLNSLLVVLIVPAAIAGGVTSSYLRDKRISVGYKRELNARYEQAERNINAKPKVDTSEDSEEAERHETLGGSDATVSQPSVTELWQAQAKRKYEQEEAVLRSLRKAQNETKLRLGGFYTDCEWSPVFTTEDGKPSQPRVFLRAIQNAAERCGLNNGTHADRVGVHTLRHYVASKLLANGVEMMVVSRILGHESIKTTVDIYGHLQDGQRRQALTSLA